MKLRFISIIIFSFIIIASCAKRGRPTGGPKDEDAPIMVSAQPQFNSVNFKKDEIKITFDEYIKLKDLNKQLIISPPMKYKPIITPTGTPSKYIKIKILDTLKENTTYTFNFGQSVVDNNEENPLRNFKYVFSTGSYIDSLKVSGTVKDAFNEEADKDISVLLYELNENFNDSTIYKEKPLYVGNSLDTTVWEITNMKAGKYKLIALKDASRNNIFNPKEDKIAFLEKDISIPEDSINHTLVLFKEILPYKLNKPSEPTKNRLLFGYEGEVNNLKIKNLNEDIPYVIKYEKDKDTLNYWYKKAKIDSLYLQITNGKFIDTITVNRRSKKVDSLQVSTNVRGELPLNKSLEIMSNTPIQSVDTTKISLTDRDTVSVAYTVKFKEESKSIKIDFKKNSNSSYKLQILPNAIEDFLGNKNDTLKYTLKTKQPSDYGNLYFTFQNVKSYPILVQLIDSSSELVESEYVSEEKEVAFKLLKPAKYKLRVIYDDNKNGKWDAGNYLKKLQPEKVVYYPEGIEVRANWDMPLTFVLKSE